MAILPGIRLGPYEILSAIGAGGMGEVYKARDTRLDRIVAIKVLPTHLADQAELRERFEREAKTIASLNHPHICTLFDTGHQDDVDFLVMEYIEGETLAQRLLKGSLPIQQALQFAIEIADALDKAHRKGITHRDLKPGNIMLTKSGTKLLDFGLAKLRQDVAPATSLSQLPTMKDAITAQGSILGTLQYMAPEQLEAKEADGRTDIFAFGAVVYEMATGKRAFDGKSQATVISAIMSSDPPAMSLLHPMTPPQLDRVVRKCLAKEPDERWQTACDLTDALKWAAEGGSQAGVPAPIAIKRKNREKLAWSLACGFAILAVALAFWSYLRPRSTGASPVLAFIPSPSDTHLLAFGFGSGPVVVSPDGNKLAFSAIDKNGVIKLWTRSLKATEAAPVPGTDGAANPFWSPDNNSLGFFAGGKLKIVDLVNGASQVLTDSSAASQVAWAPDGTILFRPAANSPLFRVPASGGKATPLGTLGANDYLESNPAVLPDGRQFLVVVTDKKQHKRVELRSLASSGTKLVLDDADFPAYSDGFLLFIRNGKLFAQSFDPGSGKLSAGATPVVDADRYSVGGRSVLAFQASSSETLLQWYDLSGNPLGTVGQVGDYRSPRLSPDGKQILIAAIDPQNLNYSDLWSLPAAGGVANRITFGPSRKFWSVWSPDGKYIAYDRVASDGRFTIVRKPSDGSGAEETLLTLGPEISGAPVVDWSPDGRYLAYDAFNISQGLMANWILPLFGDKKPFQVAAVSANQYDGNFSPDGHWLSYFSYDTGQPEVYVVPFPGPGGKFQISHGGGWNQHWDRKGDLFFLSTGNQVMKAELSPSAQSLQVKSLRALFQINLVDAVAPLFDVTPDGQRVLAVTPAQVESASIGLLLNWPEMLRK